MAAWMKFVHLGDTVVMIPAAAAIAAWLIAGRVWRMAGWWCLLFSIGLGLVVASKIAFIGWGTGVRGIDFKAVSGHAMSTTAVLPVIFYLLLRSSAPDARAFGVLLGVVFGALMGILLIVINEHSASEAVAGCVIGAIVSLSFVRISEGLPSPSQRGWRIVLSVLVIVAVWYAQPVSVDYWMTRVALHLSGHDRAYSWHTWELMSSASRSCMPQSVR